VSGAEDSAPCPLRSSHLSLVWLVSAVALTFSTGEMCEGRCQSFLLRLSSRSGPFAFASLSLRSFEASSPSSLGSPSARCLAFVLATDQAGHCVPSLVLRSKLRGHSSSLVVLRSKYSVRPPAPRIGALQGMVRSPCPGRRRSSLPPCRPSIVST